ncbi:TusE/DsrC/DsvC family sulfur relay protein [Oceanimonas sp. CHS3-5]|uniref:TusE/DsrC/DsvC family sulfur relay protein n=1 Tax=Oceanimonas sp. CHS3-5 TaxID=3068186 RepID=UPI00273FB11F|nr:TusE/DsrC/DsvC family sulfur relay protein [Oceanimonas sp. CHS3-5]MDP5291402.1 TusE/DsrC/DsvC family sulfur relay protein [Oceanimonas sp. CHS3-5]
MFEFEGRPIDTDAQGYLKNHLDWQPAMAERLAEEEGITLTAEHREVIQFVRAFYLKYNTSPAIRALVKAMAKELGEDKGNSRYLYRLFPKGPAKQATKLAGLPKPVKCI